MLIFSQETSILGTLWKDGNFADSLLLCLTSWWRPRLSVFLFSGHQSQSFNPDQPSQSIRGHLPSTVTERMSRLCTQVWVLALFVWVFNFLWCSMLVLKVILVISLVHLAYGHKKVCSENSFMVIVIYGY